MTPSCDRSPHSPGPDPKKRWWQQRRQRHPRPPPRPSHVQFWLTKSGRGASIEQPILPATTPSSPRGPPNCPVRTHVIRFQLASYKLDDPNSLSPETADRNSNTSPRCSFAGGRRLSWDRRLKDPPTGPFACSLVHYKPPEPFQPYLCYDEENAHPSSPATSPRLIHLTDLASYSTYGDHAISRIATKP